MKKILLGLLGAGIQRSLSPALHEEEGRHHGLRVHYQLIDFADPAALPGLVSALRLIGFAGFNVTYPYKQAVMPLLDVKNLDDVIQAANNTRYGLAAYCFTNDLTIAWKMAEGLEAGIIGINDTVPATAQAPFGGMKESGIGREGGHEGLECYLETKYVSIGM